MPFHFTKGLLIAAISSLTVTACAAPTMQGRDGSPFAMLSENQQAGGFHRGGHGGMHRLMKDLDLSDAQRSAIRDILKADRQKPDGSARQAMKDLRASLLAPSIDAAQLESQLQAMQAKRADRLDRFVSQAGKIRDVLTPAQREKFASLQAPKAHRGSRFAGKGGHKAIDRMLTGLTLTDQQQQAVASLKAAMEKQRGARSGMREQKQQAMAAFARSGDGAALKQALSASAPQLPIHEIAQLAASLDQSQRQQIAKTMGEKRQQFQRRHHSGGHGQHPRQ
jgi:Spy/CpxP family protein refolding chaperone